MPFRIERPQSPGMPPLVLARDHDGELMWDPREREAAQFEADEADAIVAKFNLHDVQVRGVRKETGS